MREIKFRAWHKEAEQYFDGSTANMFQWLEDGQPVILEQYTGLKDCEGTEIYEGDVVQYHIANEDKPRNAIVRHCKWFSAFRVVDVGDDYGPIIGEFGDEVLTVIGNIHQNPELLPTDTSSR